MILLGDIAAEVMFAAGILLMTVILFRRFKRTYRRRNRNTPEKQVRNVRSEIDLSESHSDQPLHDAPKEMLRWQVEMHETARQLKAELDSKLSAVQAATARAVRETQRLEEAIARAENGSIPVDSNRNEVQRDPEPTSHEDPLDEIVCQLRKELSHATQSSDTSNAKTEDVFSPQDRYLVYEYADQGMTSSEIARQSGIPIGDIELILGSRPSQKRTSN